MRKFLYNRALFFFFFFFFCIKNVKRSHFHDVIEKEVFYPHSKENQFVV